MHVEKPLQSIAWLIRAKLSPTSQPPHDPHFEPMCAHVRSDRARAPPPPAGCIEIFEFNCGGVHRCGWGNAMKNVEFRTVIS